MTRVAPFLRVADAEASAEWYARLGFSVAWRTLCPRLSWETSNPTEVQPAEAGVMAWMRPCSSGFDGLTRRFDIAVFLIAGRLP